GVQVLDSQRRLAMVARGADPEEQHEYAFAVRRASNPLTLLSQQTIRRFFRWQQQSLNQNFLRDLRSRITTMTQAARALSLCPATAAPRKIIWRWPITSVSRLSS